MTSQPTFEGKPCKNCGSTTRFANVPRGCVKCKAASRKRCNDRNRERYDAYPRNRKPQTGNQQHKRLGVSEADYAVMLLDQDGKCAVCRNKWKRKLYLDHCHETNRVRGLLCGPCNTAIGLLGDNVEGLMRAVRYLEEGPP